jgi:hypothetical protein
MVASHRRRPKIAIRFRRPYTKPTVLFRYFLPQKRPQLRRRRHHHMAMPTLPPLPARLNAI